MASHNTKDFEFKLGKFGLILFTFGISLLLAGSFLFGVVVGKNIEHYPEKIAKEIPKTIKQKIIETSELVKAPESQKKEILPPEQDTEEVKLTFYDSLTKQNKESIPSSPESKQIKNPQEKTNAGIKNKLTNPEQANTCSWTIQIASFKEKDRTVILQNKLKAVGYSSKIEKIDLKTKGSWYRLSLQYFGSYQKAQGIATHIEKNIRGIKCLIIKNRAAG